MAVQILKFLMFRRAFLIDRDFDRDRIVTWLGSRFVRMPDASDDVWEVMATARTIRRFTDEPVDDVTLARCLQAATWAPSGANAQGWRFIVLRSPQQRLVVATAAARALEVIEPVYGMSRPAADDDSRRARDNRATHPEALPDGVRTAAGWFDLSCDAELPVGRTRPGVGCVPDELGLLWR